MRSVSTTRFSSAISACEKCGEWRIALDLLDRMESEGIHRTAIAYNAAISACEKAMLPQKACDVFRRMKREGIEPSVVSYSALISAAEKGSQWKLALEILEEMKANGFPGNVVAYSAAISALAKGQQWEKALFLFREIQSCGGQPSIVTYNATMTALEKSLQWERALDMFEEMKTRNLPITVVSYGSAICACDKGLQYRQCLEFLDEMTEMGIQKNVIIFGAALSCMEKCSRADIGFQLMERMRIEGIQPNVHVYNSAISACARSNLWEKGYELFREMDDVGVKRDVVTYNAILDAVASQIQLGRRLFEEGVKKGFYACVSRLGKQWFELDLHFLSLGGGEIALGWWFEECLVPYLVNTEKLRGVNSISIVTGYGKTRTRGRRLGDDGMRKRCRAMLRFMNIKEVDQKNAGRIHVDKEALIAEVNRNGGKVVFDLDSYIRWKETETTANDIPDVPQKIRARFKPVEPGSGRPPFVRVETENTSPEYRLENMKKQGFNPLRGAHNSVPPVERPSGDARSENNLEDMGMTSSKRGRPEDRPASRGRDNGARGHYNPPRRESQPDRDGGHYPRRPAPERRTGRGRGYSGDRRSHYDHRDPKRPRYENNVGRPHQREDHRPRGREDERRGGRGHHRYGPPRQNSSRDEGIQRDDGSYQGGHRSGDDGYSGHEGARGFPDDRQARSNDSEQRRQPNRGYQL